MKHEKLGIIDFGLAQFLDLSNQSACGTGGMSLKIKFSFILFCCLIYICSGYIAPELWNYFNGEGH